MKKLQFLCILGTLMVSLSGCGWNQAKKNYNIAVEQYEKGEYEEALGHFEKAIQLNSEKAEYYIDYAYCLLKNHQTNEAIVQFNRAILDEDVLIVKENNKKAYRGCGIAYYESNNYLGALENFQKALAINVLPEMDVDLLYYIASCQEKAGLYDTSIMTYDNLLEDYPKEVLAYEKRGNVKKLAGDYEGAAVDYQEALKLSAQDYNAYFGLYDVYMEQGNQDQAKTVLNQALALKVVDDEDKLNVAKIHYYLEEYDTAVTEFTQLSKAGNVEAFYYLGEIYAAQSKQLSGDQREQSINLAVDNYETYLQENPSSQTAALYNQIAVCLMDLKQYDRAMEYVLQGIALNDASMNQVLLMNEVAIYESAGKFDQAWETIQEYCKLYPDDQDGKKEYEFLENRVVDQENQE